MNAEIDINNISNDPQDLLNAFNQLESGGAGAKPDDPQPNDLKNEDKPKDDHDKGVDQSGKQEEDGKQADKDQVDEQKEPEGVATKDGKHVIPYSVLKSERDKAARAEQMLQDALQKVAVLEAQQKTSNPGTNTGDTTRANDQDQSEELSEDDLNQLKEDFPTVYKAFMATKARTAQLESKLNPVEQSIRDMEQQKERTVADEVQDAIDSVPKLAHIQATDKEAFAMAQQFDGLLRNQSHWDGKPLSERFAKVVEMVESSLGRPIDLPAAHKNDSMNADEMAKAAREKAESLVKANKSNVPTSLSDFPAGNPAAQDELSAVENMTAIQLAAKLAKMSPQQMDEYFQSL